MRPDVLVIDGGIIDVPGHPDLGPFGLGRGLAYACMAETMMLTLDGHLRNTSLGTDLAPEALRMLHALADRHGFRVAQLRSFGRPLSTRLGSPGRRPRPGRSPAGPQECLKAMRVRWPVPCNRGGGTRHAPSGQRFWAILSCCWESASGRSPRPPPPPLGLAGPLCGPVRIRAYVTDLPSAHVREGETNGSDRGDVKNAC